MQQQDTGETPVVCRHLSSAFHERLETEYGKALAENGGYVTFTIHMEGWREPRWWEKALRFIHPPVNTPKKQRTDSK